MSGPHLTPCLLPRVDRAAYGPVRRPLPIRKRTSAYARLPLPRCAFGGLSQVLLPDPAS